MSDNGRSWHKQEKVIQELIRPTNLSLSEIAERVGLGERTLYLGCLTVISKKS